MWRQRYGEGDPARSGAGGGISVLSPALRRQWFGRREGLHLDAWMAVRAVDGWAVSLRREPGAPGGERLWFVNLGAYRPDSLAELHHFGLVVARSAAASKAAAKRRWLRDALQKHKDDLVAVDDSLDLEQLELLEPHPQGLSQPQVPDWCGYRPI